jgi:hypothetical protein
MLLRFGICSLQGEVQSQHVHSWLAKNSKAAARDALLQQDPDICSRHAARVSHAFDLQGCVGWANIRIQAGGRGCEHVGWQGTAQELRLRTLESRAIQDNTLHQRLAGRPRFEPAELAAL